MKKVFAFLSTLLLTIALVGISAGNAAQAASDKWTVDPTLAEDEIPVYIMDSIMSTFPNFYDNEALPDAGYSVGRDYPWNETRLRVAQFDEDGNPTGKYYAIYFAGSSVAINPTTGNPQSGAGNLVYAWRNNPDEESENFGKLQSGRYDGGKFTEGAISAISLGSLSHMRVNASNEDVTINAAVDGKAPTAVDTTYLIRSAIFDAKGNIIRASGAASAYDTETQSTIKLTPEYCYVNGEVTKYGNVSECDHVYEQATNEDGSLKFEADGVTPVYDDKGPDYVANRFVWQYFDEEPTNVNTVPYLSEGWDYNLWDYCYAEGEGYIAIAFCGASYQNALAEDAQNYEMEKLIAGGMGADEAKSAAAAINRACTTEFTVPAGGMIYVNGYLDQTAMNTEAMNAIAISGYKYGRTALTDTEGNATPIASVKTYNFSVSGLSFYDKVLDNTSYQLMEGQNTVEIMQGTKFNPYQNILYDGVMKYWSVPNDVTSYKADESVMEFYINAGANGANQIPVVYPNSYETSEEMIADFFKDFNAYNATNKGYKLQDDGSYAKVTKDADGNEVKELYVPVEIPTKDTPLGTAAGSWYASINGLVMNNKNNAFVNVDANWEKWGWLFEYIAANQTGLSLDMTARTVTSPGNFTYTFLGFLTGQNAFGGWPSNKTNWANNIEGTETPLYQGWIDTRTSYEKWCDYEIDATTAMPGDNWTVTYRALNTETNNESSLTIKYVVVDSYTPIIKVNKDLLYVTPKIEGDKKVIAPIDEYTLVNAYIAQYNGVNILGNDITQNVEFDTALDFSNPTEGVHEVVATIWNNSHTKKASVKFNVTVYDITAPVLKVRPISLNQGDDFDFRDVIVYAYDAVDGNLLEAVYDWYLVDSVDTSKAGSVMVKLAVYDKSNNETKATVKVTINPKTNVKDGFASADAVTDLSKTVAEIQEQVAALSANNAALQASVATLSETVDSVVANTNKVSKNGTVLAFGIINAVLVLGAAGAGAYFLVLKKKPAEAKEAE